MDWRPFISQDPKILGGKPCVAGTRVSVELVLERLGAGWIEEEIHASLPTLPRGAVPAACLFAAHTLSLRREILLEEAM